MDVLPEAPSRIQGHGPISVIDIGSNSVRLVTYERLSRSPTPIFNEKALCGLGSGLAETGRLDVSAIENAIAAIHRFKAIADQLRSVELFVLATAAAREAENGSDFIHRVAEIADVEPIVLSGMDEAHLAGLGVLSGFFKSDGVIGDMGGGSVEFAPVKDNEIESGATTPLGGLRLQDMSDLNPKTASAIAKNHLDKINILKKNKEKTFYAIGGTWRSLASLHMKKNKYPLNVLHHYSVPGEEMARFCEDVIKMDQDDIRQIGGVSKNRAPLVPYGAAVLLQITEKMKPSEVVISALGLREGLLYEHLNEAEKEQDGLIAGAKELSLLRARAPKQAEELFEWTASYFAALGLDENQHQRRLREAACLLSDIGWRAHPDYRGQQCLNTIIHAAFICIDHPGRVFVGLAAFFRHEGKTEDKDLPKVAQLIENKDMLLRARLLGLAFRTAHLISASVAGTLLQSCFVRRDDKVILEINHALAPHVGERLMKRLNQIGKVVDQSVEIEVI